MKRAESVDDITMKITFPRRFSSPPPTALRRPRGQTGLERDRGPGKPAPAAAHGELDDAQLEWIRAIDLYKRVNRCPFPTHTEILFVAQQLGYRKVLPREIRMDGPEPELWRPAA